MKSYSSILVVATLILREFSLADSSRFLPVTKSNTIAEFKSFCHGLRLLDTDTELLTQEFSRATPDGILDVACTTARFALGERQVDTAPLNQTVVNENWSQTCIYQPHCIVQPTEAHHVSTLFKIISFFEVKFATRSGGHSPNPGWASIGSEGILLDMSRMNSIILAGDGKVVNVGPGARWGDVVAALDPYNITVVAGRDPTVGVAGLVLGGGYSHLSPTYGLVADNVKNFEVVLADGTVLDANSDRNKDLFWALKGGGSNFGVVTRFDLETVPISKIWLQIAVYSLDQAPEVLEAYTKWQNDENSDHKSTVGIVIGLDAITLALVYFGPSSPLNAFTPFFDLDPLEIAIPPMNTTFTFLNNIFSTAFPSLPARHDFRGVSSYIDAQLYKDVYRFWLQSAQAMRNITGANQTFVFQHIPASMVQQGRNKGGNPLSLELKHHQWWTTTIDWERSQDDELVRTVSIDTVEQWKKLSRQRGLDLPFIFMNDASREQNPLASYGSESVDKLKRISHKYDPKQLFQTLQGGGFLLSGV
ncbi:FAD-binding domain-containing protein [Daldinia grandis]|nr:FAD-binding domain-containing protein [Daldinia grandis]